MGELIQMTTASGEPVDQETIVIVPRKKHLPVAKGPLTTPSQPVGPTLRLKAIRPKKRQLRFHHGQRGMTVVLRDQAHQVVRVVRVTRRGKLTVTLSKQQLRTLTAGPFYVTLLVAQHPATTVKYVVAG
ncbi:hypothetical protein LZY01_11210 [Levilactobacillus zymae]|uniref:Uncharacterized protein n=1 Tax=Levilactobacillus zymae TaxID=267363 RepID=A0ABQ0WWC9_9LACO|nr:hypothetical protein [Levilactobacillus zymae]KRL09583.1 hypothetical protein FD38_GL002180 [Levilactobacillus zymae DSM 19395]QFR62287.1 hypothetical protein LZ395_12375 [Levilactobacillus zymae]GEO71953.1 hypothetical protein LZY01_11210 [Levilactobacillus zymae]